MHNGGFHSFDSETKTYKEKSFEFKKDNPINFLDSDNLCFLVLECMNMLFEIASHPNIQNISQITHNYAEIEFIKTN